MTSTPEVTNGRTNGTDAPESTPITRVALTEVYAALGRARLILSRLEQVPLGTLKMIGAQMEDWDGEAVSQIPAARLDRTFSLIGPMLGLSSDRWRSVRVTAAFFSTPGRTPTGRGLAA